MDSLEKSILGSLDAAEPAIYSYLPYILQDSWEIGISVDEVIALVRTHTKSDDRLKILDLGCGKGPVSVRLAAEFRCQCLGIDGMSEFIAEAERKAREYGVEDRCRFRIGDIRYAIRELTGYDVIVLGAIGPVFGDYEATLSALEPCLAPDGIILIDDGYYPDDDQSRNPDIPARSTILLQMEKAGMRLIDEQISDRERLRQTDHLIFTHLERRCRELMEKYPDRKGIFEAYIQKQIEENRFLETEIICSIMVIGRIKGLQDEEPDQERDRYETLV